MRMKTWHLSLLLLALAWGSGCSKDQFAGTPKSDSYTASNVQLVSLQTCANRTLIKPPVDVLYLVDNSQSSQYINVKEQLRNTIQRISGEFDYHIMVAPMLPDGQSDTSRPTIVSSTTGLSSSVVVVSLEGLTFFSTGTTGANTEETFSRAVGLVSNNRSNGIFRNNANTIIVLVSNGNETSVYNNLNGFQSFDQSKFTTKYNAFIGLRNSLNAATFRYFSIVASSTCVSGYANGDAYRRMSQAIYATQNLDGTSNSDQSGRSTPDSYDLCNNQYTALYDGVNGSIHQNVIPHKYNYWPISNDPTASINTNDIHVYKISGSTQTELAADMTNGYQYVGALYNQNTRYSPTAGEPATGLFVKLFGSGEVTYPDCVLAKTSSAIEYYNYVVAPTKPVESSIIVRIRGVNVPQSSTNGWSYVGYLENQNIKINSDGTPNTTSPVRKTGYFVKLTGSYVYSSGDTVEIFYSPASI